MNYERHEEKEYESIDLIDTFVFDPNERYSLYLAYGYGA